ncbi:hypothetical protein H6P81_008262 [Aristolochia fimbriata]|uniref:Uncharacterized protein n=1 Tax=Aristolochia fimbriata TaxID=158543 RepID=A0AAV7F721_ARIFI|nr:hypothetical protein H6P81_008262 [Aristolochia fimbriata]
MAEAAGRGRTSPDMETGARGRTTWVAAVPTLVYSAEKKLAGRAEAEAECVIDLFVRPNRILYVADRVLTTRNKHFYESKTLFDQSDESRTQKTVLPSTRIRTTPMRPNMDQHNKDDLIRTIIATSALSAINEAPIRLFDFPFGLFPRNLN